MPRQEPETIKVTRAAFHSGDRRWKTCDVLENNGRRWLVGRWIQTKQPGLSIPERIVLMEGLDVEIAIEDGSVAKANSTFTQC